MKDSLSPIADFYPSNIKLDINNQPYAWMGINLIPFIDAERIQKIVKIVLDNNKLTDKEKKLNERGDNLLISRDLEILKKFEGELKINDEINSYNQYLKEDSIIKGIHPGNVKTDKSQTFIFKKRINNKKHCSNILNGVIPHKKCIIEDNLDNYEKDKFKGDQAIRIVKEVLGTWNDNLEGDFIKKTYDSRYGNNNRSVSYNPHKKFLLNKKRYQERQVKGNREKRKNSNNSSSNKKYNENNNYRARYNPRYSKRNYDSKYLIKEKKRNNFSNNKPNINLEEDWEEKEDTRKRKENRRTKKRYNYFKKRRY